MEQLPHPRRADIDLAELFAALGSPRRLELMRAIADGAEHDCSDLRGPTPKSTMTHHWKTLRNAGAIWQRPEGRAFRVQLRREDLDARFPGLLDAVFGVRVDLGIRRRTPAKCARPQRPRRNTLRSGRFRYFRGGR